MWLRYMERPGAVPTWLFPWAPLAGARRAAAGLLGSTAHSRCGSGSGSARSDPAAQFPSVRESTMSAEGPPSPRSRAAWALHRTPDRHTRPDFPDRNPVAAADEDEP